MRIYDEEERKLREKLEKRCFKLNSKFEWTQEKAQKIIELNNGLLERYREAYNELNRVYNEFEERYRAGDNNYRNYEIEVEFWYNHEEGMSEKEEELWDDLCEETDFWGCSLLSRKSPDRSIPYDEAEKNNLFGKKTFEEMMSIDEYSWDEGIFRTKELAGTYIYYFMHDIFTHNHTYSMEDAVKMKAENFSWQLIIYLEHWGKSVNS